MSTEAIAPLYVRNREPLSPAESGRIGARKRWGPRRIVRLDTLHPTVRAAVEALIAADEDAKKEAPTVDVTSAGAEEVRRASDVAS